MNRNGLPLASLCMWPLAILLGWLLLNYAPPVNDYRAYQKLTACTPGATQTENLACQANHAFAALSAAETAADERTAAQNAQQELLRLAAQATGEQRALLRRWAHALDRYAQQAAGQRTAVRAQIQLCVTENTGYLR